MKKVILFILLAGFLTTANAQKQSYAEKKSKETTAYVAEKMNLDKDKASFLQATLLEKYVNTSKETKGLSAEEKKVVYKKSYKVTSEKLAAQFSKDEVKEIFGFIKELNQKNK